MNFPASIPEVTAVGGTEFNEGNGNYWGATNGANGGSALGYIPEMAWNDTGIAQYGESTRTASTVVSRRPAAASAPFIRSRPGKSARAFRPTASGTCRISRWRRPIHDPYNIITSGQAIQVGGTSAATPVFAGMLALLNQHLKGNGAGNINATLYGLAIELAIDVS